jgi:hypothetical protein
MTVGIVFPQIDGRALGLVSKDAWLLVHDQQCSDVLANAGLPVSERLSPTLNGPSGTVAVNDRFRGL